MNTRVCYISMIMLMLSLPAHAGSINAISYDADNDMLTLDIEDVSLLDVLNRLRGEIGFELDIQNVRTQEPVSFTGSGRSLDVVRKLVGAESAVLSRSKVAPFRLNNVILLPSGEEQTSYLPTGDSGSESDGNNSDADDSSGIKAQKQLSRLRYKESGTMQYANDAVQATETTESDDAVLDNEQIIENPQQ